MPDPDAATEFEGPEGTAFEEFAAEVRSLVGRIGVGVDTGDLDPTGLLDVSIAESAQTLRVLARAAPRRSDRLLEVGSGLGLTSIFLERQGYDIVSVEPAAAGFSFHERVAGIVFEALGAAHRHIADAADEIPSATGPFDVIFSNNVLEHIAELLPTLDHLSSLLAADGRMIHSCPNYSFPYEPHFGVPLLPVRPALTARILPGRISDSELWASLNFVTARRIERWGERSGMTVEFRQGQLADSIERLTRDAEFARRHRVMTRIAAALEATRVTRALRHLPARMSTPMEFTVTAASSGFA